MAPDDNALADVLRRLDRLESKDAIRDLVTHYATACDQHDMPTLMSLFTLDAVFDSPNGGMVADGRAAIERMFIETFKIRGPSYHWTHDVTITMATDDPDHATGLVYSHAETTPNGVVSLAAMRYHDNYQRIDQRWQFCKRVISFLYYVPAVEFPTGLTKKDRVFMGTQWVDADYPENLRCWQAFAAEHGA